MSIPPPPGPQDQYPQPPHAQMPPYQTWGHAYYTPPNPPAPVNGLAISALVLGLLCFLPAVGLVLGLIALAQINKRGERGKAMAIAGTVLSSIGLAFWVLILTTSAASDFWDGFQEAANDSASLSVAKGECFDSSSGSLEGLTYDVDEVPCAGRHDGEVFATVTLPGGSYPGEDHLAGVADDKCYALQPDYAMDSWALPGDVDVYHLTPTSESWRYGDREITCVFGNTDSKGTLTGSLRADETTLDTDQVAFLKASNAVDEVLEAEPGVYAEDNLPGARTWAGKVEDVLGEQAAALGSHPWRSDVSKPVADVVKDLEAARKEWAKAAAATDADAYYEHYDKGYELIDGSTTVTARKALGLGTTPPWEDGDEGGADDGAGDAGVDV